MRRLFSIVALLALFGLTLAGCGQGSSISAADIVQKMQDTAASTNDAHIVISGAAAISSTAASGVKGADTKTGADAAKGMNGQISVEMWFKKPNLVKIQVQSSSASQINGFELLHDGTNFWAYDASKKMAYKVQASAIRGLASQANIPADLQDILANPSLEDAINSVLALTDYKLLGEEHVGQWDTYKLELTPKTGNAVASVALTGAKATIWVDKVTWAIVKAEGVATQGNGSIEVNTLDLNKGIADSEFQFTLPDGGHVIDLSSMVPQSMTIVQARVAAQAAGWKLLEPSYVPAGATLVQVMGSSGMMGRAGSYVLSYSGGANTPSFWISEMKGAGSTSDDMMGGAGASSGGMMGGAGLGGIMGANSDSSSGTDKWTSKDVIVGGNKARLATDPTGKTRALFWSDTKNDLSLAVGGQLSEEELLKIAASLK